MIDVPGTNGESLFGLPALETLPMDKPHEPLAQIIPSVPPHPGLIAIVVTVTIIAAIDEYVRSDSPYVCNDWGWYYFWNGCWL